MANPVRGRNVVFEVYSETAADYVFYTCAEGVSISFEPELINITTVGLGRGFAFKERRRGWSISLDGVADIQSDGRTVFTTVSQDNINATYAIRLSYEDQLGNTAVFTGNVLLEGANINSVENDFADFNNVFRGVGVYDLVQTVGGVIGGYVLLAENGDNLVAENDDYLIQENG